MKKRLLPILLTLVLVCALPLGAVFVTSGDVTSALVSAAWADTAEGEESSRTTEVRFTEVSNESDLRTAIGKGQSVKLTGDIGISSALEVKSSLTLDLNNCELKRVNIGQYENYVIFVGYNATLTIQDSAPNKTTRTYKSVVDTNEQVTTTGGVITGGRNSGVYIGADNRGVGNLVMTGGTIVGCESSFQGGGVYVDKGTFTMSGTARITDCSAVNGGGGVAFQNRGAFIMLGGEISDCSAPSGGGVYGIAGGSEALQEGVNGSFTMKGGRIYGCTATYGESYGGAIYMNINNMFAHGGEVRGSVCIIRLKDESRGIWHLKGEDYTVFNGTIYTEEGTSLAAQYPITYDLNGGSTGPESTTVALNSPLAQPDTPVRPGHKFTGWTVTVTGTQTVVSDFEFGSTPVTKPLTLTAQWTVCDHSASENRPTCTEGVKCSVCAADLPAKGHRGGEATCAAKAKCSVCQAEYGDLEPNNHADLTHVLAAAATTKAEGNIEYWHCTGCGRYFSDAQAAEEITQADTVLAKLPPRYYYNSGAAAKPDSGKKNSPGTADPGVMLYGAAALLSLTGMAVLTGKKK